MYGPGLETYLPTTQKDDQHISWKHLQTIYNKSASTSGLTLLPKLKREHNVLNSYSRMRVDLAAQVYITLK